MSKISICIPTFNRQKELIKLLETLQTQHYNHFEVSIVEGGDLNLTKRLISKLRLNFSIIINGQKEPGLVNARNEAWKHAEGDIMVFIDDDIIPEPYWLHNIVKTYSIAKNIGAVGGPSIIRNPEKRDLTKYLFYNRNNVGKLITCIYNNLFLEKKPFEINKFYRSGAFSLGSMSLDTLNKIPDIIDVDYLDASNMSFRRDILELVGGFDLIYKGVGDYSEPDLCFKVKNNGFRIVYNKRAMVYHYPSTEGVFVARSFAYNRGYNYGIFLKRWIGINKLSLLYSIFLSIYYLKKAIEDRNTSWLTGIKGIIDGYRVNTLHQYEGISLLK